MAEAFGIVAGGLTVLELTAKVVKQCQELMETVQGAPRDLRHILIEVSSLKAILESFEFLSRPEFSDTAQSLADADGVVEGCRNTIEEISKELDGLSISNATNTAPGKRQRIKSSVKWCLKESKTRKLLDETMKYKSTLTLALLGEIATDVKEVKGKVEQVHDRLDATRLRMICDWVEQINPTSIHHRACKSHEENTCGWIHRVDQWNDWLLRQQRLIWIHGIPGAGKTVLASYLVEQTISHCKSQNPDRSICLFYYCSFTHRQADRDEALPFLRWLVSQLCRKTDHVPIDVIINHQSNNALSLEALENALKTLLERIDVLYVILDAVDESSPRDHLLEVIQTLATQAEFEKIRLLVTSRRYGDIEAVLRPLSGPTLPMSNSTVDEDIRAYVEATMNRTKNFTRWPPLLLRDITESLVQGAQGMFRWAVCQIDRLRRKSHQQAREAIKSLPRTLEDTYEVIFMEISEDDWPVTQRALQLIVGHSMLDFTCGIPANCLSIAVLDTKMSLEPDSPHDCSAHGFLKDILGCLIEIAEVDPDFPSSISHQYEAAYTDANISCRHGVTLAHYTIEEYLFSDRIKTSRARDFKLSQRICADQIMETALPQTMEGGDVKPRPYLDIALEAYYNSVNRRLTRLDSHLARNTEFASRHLAFFNIHKREWYQLLPKSSWPRTAYPPSDDFGISKEQYLNFLTTAMSQLHESNA